MKRDEWDSDVRKMEVWVVRREKERGKVKNKIKIGTPLVFPETSHE